MFSSLSLKCHFRVLVRFTVGFKSMCPNWSQWSCDSLYQPWEWCLFQSIVFPQLALIFQTVIDFLGISNTASTHAAFPRIFSNVCGIYEFRSPSPCLPLIVDNVIPNGVIFLFRSALHTNCCILLSYGEPEPLGSCKCLVDGTVGWDLEEK